MNPQIALILGLSGVNLFAILGIVFKGGTLLGNFRDLTKEVGELREHRDEHMKMLARTVAQLDALEGRVERLERRDDSR